MLYERITGIMQRVKEKARDVMNESENLWNADSLLKLSEDLQAENEKLAEVNRKLQAENEKAQNTFKEAVTVALFNLKLSIHP